MADSTNRASDRGKDRGGNSMGNRGGDSVVGNNRTGDGVGNRCGNNVREDGLAIVGGLGDVPIDVVGVVVDMLDPAKFKKFKSNCKFEIPNLTPAIRTDRMMV